MMSQEEWIALYSRRYAQAVTTQDILDIDMLRIYNEYLTEDTVIKIKEISAKRVNEIFEVDFIRKIKASKHE